MITLTIKYFAALAEQAGTTQEQRKIAHSSIPRLYQELSAEYNFSNKFEDLRVAVNASYVDANTELQNGDSVVFITPVAGG